MAKKINTDSSPLPAGQIEPVNEKMTGRPVQSNEESFGEVNLQVKHVLQAYPGYRTLYVDHYGGAYTPDTPAPLRKGAILYENPFFYEPAKVTR